MGDPINNGEIEVAESAKGKGAGKASLNFFNNIVSGLNLKKVNQANTIFLILISIYFFVVILLVILNPVALRGFNYGAYLQVGLIALIGYGIFFSIVGNLKRGLKKKKTRKK